MIEFRKRGNMLTRRSVGERFFASSGEHTGIARGEPYRETQVPSALEFFMKLVAQLWLAQIAIQWLPFTR
jgi:hypothetical protein